MPLDDIALVIEPSYPKAKEIMAIGKAAAAAAATEQENAQYKIRNSFRSSKHHGTVFIWEEGGKVHHGVAPHVHHFDQEFSTMMASLAWGIEQEVNAVQTLAGLVRHHQMKSYLLTGMFIEKSQRSGKTYVFRRLRPTIVLTERNAKMVILTALCMHPIGYYAGSWAGAMCPTDDVIAHLSLMRGDEQMFWRRANQIPPHLPEAGL